MINLPVTAILQAAGSQPLVQAGAIILGTFILEDAATVLAGLQVEGGRLAWPVALGALYVGVVLGDLGLYGLGKLAALWPFLLRWIKADQRVKGREWVQQRVFRVVFVSRFMPGARLPTYTACGFLSAGFWRFASAAVAATLVWTTVLFAVSLRVGQWLIDHLGAWRWLGALTFVALLVLAGRLLSSLQRVSE